MNGVEILASEQVAISFNNNWVAFWITFGIIFFLFIILGTLNFIDYEIVNGIGVIIVGGIVSMVAGSAIGTFFSTPKDYETQYKVTISEEVSMTEFLEKYEVITQDGKIFTIREKDNKEKTNE